MTPLRITWGAHSAIAYKRDIGFGGGAGRRAAAGDRPVVAVRGRARHPLRGRAVVGRGAGRAAARHRRRRSCSGSRGAVSAPAPARRRRPPRCRPAVAALRRGDRCRAHRRAARAGCCAGRARRPRRPARRRRSRGSSPPATRSSASRTCTAAATGCRWTRSRRPTTAPRASSTCSTAAGCCPSTTTRPRATLESFGAPGPGRWVTIYASADHVFMYVAGLRWDTHNAAGPDDGSTGIGWHPLVRERGRVRRPPPGGAVRRAAAVGARGSSLAGARSPGAAAERPASPPGTTATTDHRRPRIAAEAQRTHEYPTPGAPADRRRRLALPGRGRPAFATAYINWNCADGRAAPARARRR